MPDSLLLFDGALAVMLMGVAVRVLLAREAFQATVLFVVFGLLLAIVWCRLGAVDVALAEAAIGAGLTGALLLNTLASIGPRGAAPFPAASGTADGSRFGTAAVGLAAGAGTLLLAVVVVPLAASRGESRIPVASALPDSGVTNPVTAVLLNFRAYDTLLEVGVLLLAGMAVVPWAAPRSPRPSSPPCGPVLAAFVRVMLPVLVLVAAFVLWSGTSAPGGAFQAAALLAAGGVLLLATGAAAPGITSRRGRAVLTAGLAVFVVVALGSQLAGGKFLEYPPRGAGLAILLIETVLTVSIALVLVVLFAATSPEDAS